MFKHIFTLIWNKKQKNFLLFLEIFFSFMILFVVFGFVIANLRLYQVPLGFDTNNQWVAPLSIDDEIADSTETAQMKTALLNEISQMPHVESASFGCNRIPFRQSMWTTGTDDNGFELFTCILMADEHFAKTRGINIIEGRWFTEDDKLAKYIPVVVSNKLIEESFKGRKFLDSLFIFDEDLGDFNRIVGVFDHYKYFGEFDEEWNASFFYMPSTSVNTPILNMKIVENAPPDLEEKINKRIVEISKFSDLTIMDLEHRRKNKSKETWVPMIGLLTICGFLVINVALGLFGVLWYNISKRRSEIGLRRTLGATPGNITRQFISEVLLITFFAILVGLLFAVQFPLMEFFDTENINYYYAMMASAVLILVVVFICSVFPSSQAAKIHPALALHED